MNDTYTYANGNAANRVDEGFYFYLNEDASSVITVVRLYAAPANEARYIKADESSIQRYLSLYCGYSVALEEVLNPAQLKAAVSAAHNGLNAPVAKKESPVLASGMTAEEEAIVAAALADQLKRKAAKSNGLSTAVTALEAKPTPKQDRHLTPEEIRKRRKLKPNNR